MTVALALVVTPLALAAAALLLPSNALRPWLLPVAGVAHAGLTASVLAVREDVAPGDWFGLDLPGRLVLALVSVLFLCCAIHATAYLRHRRDRPNRVFCACLLAVLSSVTVVVWSRHLGVMWVAVEAAALATGPLVWFNGTAQSIEATWKYLLVGSVGLAVALLGSFFLAYAALHAGLSSSLLFEDLIAVAPRLSKPWLHSAFVLLLVGYGTKMGLAPMHTWKPDTYGEAPGVVGAFLAGGVSSCAFLALLRVVHLCNAAGEAAFTGKLLVAMGLLSMGVAAVSIAGQRDLKRMLAWSSVEHMGILALGVGVGGLASFGALLHVVTNGLTKGVLFLSAANIHRAFGSRSGGEVRGAFARVPLSAALFFAGFLAITGSPPFGPFLSELTIVTGMFGGGRFAVGALFLLFLLIAFIGMGATVLRATQGRPPEPAAPGAFRESVMSGAPIVALLAMVLLLGVWVPPPLADLLRETAAWLEGHP